MYFYKKISSRYFATELEQNIFLEEDPKSKCRVYNSVKTYDECDRKFIKNMLQRHYPPTFTPVWATDNMSEVTKLWVANSSSYPKLMEQLVVGTRMSNCPDPCTSTKIKTVYLDEKMYDREGVSSRIDITFSDNVDTYINDFPKFHFSSFLAEIGGAIGLWLGLGVIQIMETIMNNLCTMNNVQSQ